MPPKDKVSLKKAVEEVAHVSAPDAVDRRANAALDEETRADRTSTRTLRERYAKRVFVYLVCYSISAVAILGLQGWHVAGFQLHDGVVGVIVGSTAVSAIGLVGIVVRGLFRQ
jgi:hypothetical protein